MECQRCQSFLQDFLGGGLPHDLEIVKKMKRKPFHSLIPEISDWIERLYSRVSTNEFNNAKKTANKIARRGRKRLEYTYLVNTATFHLLQFELPWIETDLNYLKVLLVEAGVFHGKHAKTLLTQAQEFLAYLAITCFHCLLEIHDDHLHPKGLFTNIGSVIGPQKGETEEKEETLCDRDDDYQKEILAEDDALYF